MIGMLSLAVSDKTYEMVSWLYGESVALDLCYEDAVTNHAAAEMVQMVKTHPPPRLEMMPGVGDVNVHMESSA